MNDQNQAMLDWEDQHRSWPKDLPAHRAQPATQPASGEAVAWLYTLTGRSGEVADIAASTSRYNIAAGLSPFGRRGVDYHDEGIVTETPLYTTPPAPLGGLTEGNITDEFGNPLTPEQCAEWLDKKWARHHEVEDRAAAAWLRRLTAPRAEGVDAVLVPREPTQAMLIAMNEAWPINDPSPFDKGDEVRRAIYAAALTAAAPKVATSGVHPGMVIEHAKADALIASHVAAAPQAEAGEERFEHYLKTAIANSPQPLQDLGAYLTDVLDEDEWPTAERFLLQLATAQPAAQSAS